MYSHKGQHTPRTGTTGTGATNSSLPRTQRVIPSAPTRGQFTFGATPERGSNPNPALPTRDLSAGRPIAHMRAKRYALQQQQQQQQPPRDLPDSKSKNKTPQAVTPNEARRGMRRTRSIETSQSPEQSERLLERISGTGFSRRIPQHIGVGGRQQSEPAVLAGQPPARRLRTAPSSENLHAAPGRVLTRPNANTPTLVARALPPRHPHSSAQHNRTLLRGNGGSRTQPQTMRTGVAGSNAGNAMVAVSPAVPRSWTHRIPSSPGNGDVNFAGSHATQIPYPPMATEAINELDAPRGLIMNSYMEKSRHLALEREANDTLLGELNKIANLAETLGQDLAQSREAAAEAEERAERSQRAFEEQHIENEKLQKKITALMTVIKAQSVGHFTEGLAPLSPVSGQTEVANSAIQLLDNEDTNAVQDPAIGDSWRDRCAHMNSTIRAAYDACGKADILGGDDEGIQRDRRIVEEYLNNHAGAAGNLRERSLSDTTTTSGTSFRTQSSSRNNEGNFIRTQPTASLTNERVRRRRSNIVFAPFIRPSGSTRARVSSHGTPSRFGEEPYEFDPHDLFNGEDDFEEVLNCERCAQLLESLHLLELDNDYYREANDKLRSNLTEVTSSHNAMVHAFQCERQRLKDIRLRKLTDAVNVAARNRAILETQQRADLEIESGHMSLSQRADSGVYHNGERQVDGDESLAQHFDCLLRIRSPNANRSPEHTPPPSM
ncbi:hypothetical protein COEREDRAFT_92640 [Coemansia reversa NRRL 1564]|uniref:Uncharacterized protein n=1 Tax=Coemansia reversa (strain ATCC 12441 / NRRL 1564) TaxID=763665 RepID=A0A2G5BBF9_COERN|nr:hypothetical protein COEREDRAFT_92640 [Coemansia reversa NRRL 1564]|eukprot:PIA16354.1 hypothetical protein COEREDRAFT_92640 [Coemansia reversa NRRL 1564]